MKLYTVIGHFVFGSKEKALEQLPKIAALLSDSDREWAINEPYESVCESEVPDNWRDVGVGTHLGYIIPTPKPKTKGGHTSSLHVMKSNAGFYLGRTDLDGVPYSRQSQYYKDRRDAEIALLLYPMTRREDAPENERLYHYEDHKQAAAITAPLGCKISFG